jgi:pectate lyase
MGAKVLVEQNSFSNVPKAIVTNLDSDEPGFAVDKNNVFSGTSTKDITQEGQPDISYKYTADAASSVCATISSSAGTGVLSF